ncbi:Uncharacterized protein BP5553_03828 [Venustampulla echinocandica]|uniref:Uncharacterized protein n=1 Tax=Venustampulla echinocandica TaxID=2656787 RepID=A0A370TVJ5_9HELO|nr:Uncharacterized protein BP5553_03828 [Venustampulla echinocandica]RDL39488.1 Uncharacterized protein BP5553_03828 [Venustampulla echinocandica]
MASDNVTEGGAAATSPTQPSTSAPRVRKPDFRMIIRNGCRSNDIAEVSKGFELAASKGEKNQALLSWALARAVDFGHVDMARYLIEQEDAPLDTVSPFIVAHNPSTEMFQVLVDHGWDINQNSRDHGVGQGKCLLQHICHDESLVRWCLDHGAKVEGMYTDPYESPPILDMVACRGMISTFELLRSRGAQLGPRTLHRAVDGASSGGGIRMAMVKYLVDDLGLDVNTLDTEEKLPDHWGTPLCYAARWHVGHEAVVRFLLERGADPSIKDIYGNHDAFSLAGFRKNHAVVEVLQEWKENHQGE